MTVADYLREWHKFRQYKISEEVWKLYGKRIEQWLIPFLGSTPLQRLSPHDIERAYASMLSAPRKDGRPGVVSPTTVRHIHTLLRTALADAYRQGIIAHNPADLVNPPKRAQKSPRVLTVEEIHKLLDATRGTYSYAPIALAVYTGMWLGEILGLLWRDVDLSRGLISINQTLKRSDEFGQPKTRGSSASVWIGPDTVRILQEQRAWQEIHKQHPEWEESGLVCTLENGKPLRPSTFPSKFHRITKRLGFPTGFHALRHTHASLLLNAGVDLRVVQERLRHSSVAVTGNVYAHVLAGTHQEVATHIEDILKNGR